MGRENLASAGTNRDLLVEAIHQLHCYTTGFGAPQTNVVAANFELDRITKRRCPDPDDDDPWGDPHLENAPTNPVTAAHADHYSALPWPEIGQ